MVRLSKREQLVLENILQTKVTPDKGDRIRIRRAGCFWVTTTAGKHFFVWRIGDSVYAVPEGGTLNSNWTKHGYLGEPTK